MLADPAVLRKVRAGAGTGQLIRKTHCHLVIVIALDRKLVDALVLRRDTVRHTTVAVIGKAIRIDFVILRIALDKGFS